MGGEAPRARRRLPAAVVLAAALAALCPSAQAQTIDEIHVGNGSSDRAYTEIQFTSPAATPLLGHFLAIYNASGNLLSSREFDVEVAQPFGGHTALIANATELNGMTVEYPVTAGPQPGGGGVCITATEPQTSPVTGIDCVRYGPVGTLQHNPSPAGAAALATGLQMGQTLQRTHARGCATLLDAADDSNDSAADFFLASPSPRNNAAAPLGTACAPKPKCKKKGKRKKGKSSEAGATAAKKRKCKKRGKKR